MQRYLGKQKKDKRPLIRSAPPPTLSFCRLQSLVSRWQLKGVDSWIHRDLFIPKGTLSPPRASCLSAPHSVLGDSQAVRSPLCLTHPARLSYPTPITPAALEKESFFSWPPASPALLQDLGQSRIHHTWTTPKEPENIHDIKLELLVSDALLHVEVKIFIAGGNFILQIKNYFSN